MASNWVVPTADDVQIVLNSFVAGAANEEDSGGGERLDKLVTLVVEVVRGAIRSGGRVAMSLTSGSVPPEAKDIVLILVMERLVNSTPRLAKFVENDWAGWTIKDARDWIKDAREGLNVTPPSDPDPDTVPLVVEWGDASGVEVGGVAGKSDMSTD